MSHQESKITRGAASPKDSSRKPVSKEEEVDKMYDQMDGILDGLKTKSLEINRIVARHNEELPDIASAVARQQDRVDE